MSKNIILAQPSLVKEQDISREGKSGKRTHVSALNTAGQFDFNVYYCGSCGG